MQRKAASRRLSLGTRWAGAPANHRGDAVPEASVIVLIADGLRPDVFEEAIGTGEVPELAALRDTSGLNVVTTVFPSVTGVAYIVLAGVFLRIFERAARANATLSLT